MKNIEKELKLINVFTIGFSKRSAQDFFNTIVINNIKLIVDVRLNNTSQLSGYSKKDDLKFFLKEICQCDYLHVLELAPTKEILDNYKKNKISWSIYESQFNNLLKVRGIPENIKNVNLNNSCFLCSEFKAIKCHRRLVVEFLKSYDQSIKINHL